MLNLYRRHTPKCPHRAKGQNYTKCSCPIWCDGELSGKRTRRAVGLRDWARAVRRTEKWETAAKDSGAAMEPARTMTQAVESYLGDCRARKLADSTVRSYEKTIEHLAAFMDGGALRTIEDLDLSMLTDFRASRRYTPHGEDEERDIAASTSRKELEALRAFCAFAAKRGWIEQNHARDVRPPKEDRLPTLPFEPEEVDRILGACDTLEDRNPMALARTRTRARAMILTMLYSGLRISDTMRLRRATVDLNTGKLLLRVMKTGVPLYVRLGQPAVEALAALADDSEYFFWNGRSKLGTATNSAWRTISRVLAAAGVEGHPHRFRDTFSVCLLENGEDLHTVQLLLGHTSIKTTEKHYAPFVQSFQRILDAATAKLDFGTGQKDIGTKFGTVPKRAGKLLKIG